MDNIIEKYEKRLAVLKENRSQAVDSNSDSENELCLSEALPDNARGVIRGARTKVKQEEDMTLREEYENETGQLAFDSFFTADPACSIGAVPDEEYVVWLENKIEQQRISDTPILSAVPSEREIGLVKKILAARKCLELSEFQKAWNELYLTPDERGIVG